jgi:hypothetical protein
VSRSEKIEIIKEALGPNSDGTTKSTEFDLLKSNGEYIEAKSGNIEREDILAKRIRHKAHQLEGDVSDSQPMKVVGRSGRFTDARDPSGETPNAIGEFIEASDGSVKDTKDW